MAEEHTGDETGIDERLQRIRQVVQDSIERRARGEILSDQSLIEAHPDLVPELGEELRRVGVDQMAKRQADLTVDRPARTPQQDAPTRHRQETATADGRAIPPLGAIRSFGAYELLEEIERGGMGVVYKARQVSPKRIVAIKMILAGQLASDSDVQRFHNEAEAAAHLDHPGIVPIYEVGRYEDQHYFSMGYVEGSSLSAKVADGPLPPRKAAEYVRQVAEAVAFAHQYGVIHRDLKPANVLLDRNDEPRVTDFGLAKRVEGDSNLTASGQILGTPSFMPPEQAAGQIDEVAETADIYSLGAILYNLITGRPPFQADNQLDTLLQVLEQEPVSPRQLNRKVPQDLETICLKCMRKDRSRRYCTADELAADLECWLTGVPIKARPVSRTERCWRWCRRNPIGASLLATVAMLLVTLTMATILISQSWNQNKIAFAQRDEQRRQARVSSEESIFLTHVVRQGNAIDNRFSDYEGPLEDLRASVTKTLAQSPTENELVYYANHIDSGQGPMPPDLALSEAHEGKQVSIEHGTVAGLGCDNASETSAASPDDVAARLSPHLQADAGAEPPKREGTAH